jgi:hypothetical protein
MLLIVIACPSLNLPAKKLNATANMFIICCLAGNERCISHGHNCIAARFQGEGL